MHYFSSRVRRGRGKHLVVRPCRGGFMVCRGLVALGQTADNEPPPGFTALFNGKDFSGWKVPEGDGGHWKVVDGVIDYDAQSEAKGRQEPLAGAREFGDFELHVDWRLKEAPYINQNVPYILPDGTHARDIHGKEMKLALPDADSGVYLRGAGQSPGQHLVLAHRLGGDVRRPHQPEHAARSYGPPSRPGCRRTTRSASGITSRSPSGARRSGWSSTASS